MDEPNTRILIPSADRLIKSLRSVGYKFHTAIADIIDNSIDSNSTCVDILVEPNGTESCVKIIDNGIGMTGDEILEAMRFGSERVYESEHGLGKFGLGLKTASISQCKKLTVISKSSKNSREIHSFCWDLEHIKLTNKWEVIELSSQDIAGLLKNFSLGSQGTAVIWQNLDRLLQNPDASKENTQVKLAKNCRLLEEHLSMVFHRFISSDIPNRRLKIKINGNNIEPWDPFVRYEEKTIKLEPKKIWLEAGDQSGSILLQPYVLPNQNDFSSRYSFIHASGIKKWNRQQGFYIYRADRIIQNGGWSGLRTLDEHTKLARISLDFLPVLDDSFTVDISKMSVELPPSIVNEIEEAIKPVLKKAQEVYRKNTSQSQTPTSIQPPRGQNPPIAIAQPLSINNPANVPLAPKMKTFDEFEKLLMDEAFPLEKKILSGIFDRLRKKKRI